MYSVSFLNLIFFGVVTDIHKKLHQRTITLNNYEYSTNSNDPKKILALLKKG